MRKFLRYDVALCATLAAAVFCALLHFSVLAAWLAAAPLVPLLRQLLQHTAPVLWLPLVLLVLLAGAGYVVGLQAVALDGLGMGLMPLLCTLGAVGGAGYAVNGHLLAATTDQARARGRNS